MTADWKPGHSTIKTRYPYDGVESMAVYPMELRPIFAQDPNTLKVGAHVDAGKYPMQAEQLGESVPKEEHLQYLVDFLMDRAFEYQEALKVAEGQIMELLSEDPFVPEQFGFKLIHEPETIHDSPIRIYQSTFDERYTIHRPVANTLDPEWNPAVWVLQKSNDDNTIHSEEVVLPCHRIAFAYFFARDIKVMEPKVIEEPLFEEAQIIEEAQVMKHEEEIALPPRGFNNYTVSYNSLSRGFSIKNIMAQNEKDAQTQAKFLIETGNYEIDLVEFDQLTPLMILSNQ